MSVDNPQFRAKYLTVATFKHWWDYFRPIRHKQKKLVEIFLNHNYRKTNRPAFDRAMTEIMHYRKTSIGGVVYHYKDYFPTTGKVAFNCSKVFKLKKAWVKY